MSANLGAWNEDPAEVWDREHRDEEDRPRIEPHHQPGRPGGRVMAAKHIPPGQWYQCGDQVLIDMGDRPHLVATVADWAEDTEVYARLIAAAPELLEALRKAEEYIIQHTPDDGRGLRDADVDRYERQPLLATMCAAIARATGEAA